MRSIFINTARWLMSLINLVKSSVITWRKLPTRTHQNRIYRNPVNTRKCAPIKIRAPRMFLRRTNRFFWLFIERKSPLDEREINNLMPKLEFNGNAPLRDMQRINCCVDKLRANYNWKIFIGDYLLTVHVWGTHYAMQFYRGYLRVVSIN